MYIKNNLRHTFLFLNKRKWIKYVLIYKFNYSILIKKEDKTNNKPASLQRNFNNKSRIKPKLQSTISTWPIKILRVWGDNKQRTRIGNKSVIKPKFLFYSKSVIPLILYYTTIFQLMEMLSFRTMTEKFCD